MARYPRLDYTSKDYSSVLVDLQNLVRAVFPEWTDFSPGNPGEALLEAIAYVADLITYYQDRQVNESMLITAVERQNVILHLRGIGYELKTASASSADLTVTLDAPMAEDVVLPALWPVTTEDGTTSGETLAALPIPAGSAGPLMVSWQEGQTFSETLGQGTGAANQRYKLGRTPYLDQSEQIMVDGVTHTRAANFLNSLPTDPVYVLTVDADDVATIAFGDNVNGAAPVDGSQITALYRTGGGDHNVDVKLLTKSPRALIAGSGSVVPIRFTNLARASGGGPRESLAHAKIFGPASIKTGDRSVAKEDYETNAMAVSGVSRAVALTSNEDPGIEENTVNVFIVPVGGGGASDALLAAVLNQLTTIKPKAITTRIRVLRALYHPFSPAGVVYVTKLLDPIAQQSALIAAATAVQAALAAFYSPDNIDPEAGGFTLNFGDVIGISRLYQLIQDAGSVVRLGLTEPIFDIETLPREFPVLCDSAVVPVSSSRVDLAFSSSPPTLLEFLPVP